ncbi:housekeeping sortase [Corynebacterium atypicum]|uniref:Housekeeping sortase n=1 Tax=Corynebacterium atypicum TaxID=191610 RepID=A0ABN4DEW3_9CORY|nr:housekeeping sortase [Corynebacterium atypicum]
MGRNRGAPPRITFGQVAGEVLVMVGVLLLLFAFYEAFWTNLKSGQLQEKAGEGLAESWNRATGNPRKVIQPELGDAFAWLRTPAFGADYQYAVVEGTGEEALLAGPGRYPQTQMPGEPGNFALAGHRVGKGAPFNDLGALQACDELTVETREATFTYRVLPLGEDEATRRGEAAACLSPEQVERVVAGDYAAVTGRLITTPDDVAVIEPLPGAPGAAGVSELAGPADTGPAHLDPSGPSQRSGHADLGQLSGLEGMITLTTCHPQFSNAERMVIHGMLVSVAPKENVAAAHG